MVAAPGGVPALGLGQVRARHLGALGARLLGLREPGGQFAVLPVSLVPLQRHADGDRGHVGEGRATLAVHQRHAPVRALVLTGHFGLGPGHGFFRGHQGDVGVPVELVLERVRRQARVRDRRRVAQGCRGQLAHPARQSGGGVGLARLCVADPILDPRHARARHEHVGLRAATATVGRVGGLDLQGRLVTLLRQQRDHLLLVVAVEPSERRAASKANELHRARGLRRVGLALETRRAGMALVLAREGLGQADRAHGHEVFGQAEAYRPVDGQVVDRQAQRRVGQPLRRDGHFAGRLGSCILRDQGIRALLRCAQGSVQRQGLTGNCCLRRRPARKTGDEQRGPQRAQGARPGRERVSEAHAHALPFQLSLHRLNPNESGAAAVAARTKRRLRPRALRHGPKRQTEERSQLKVGGRQTPEGLKDGVTRLAVGTRTGEAGACVGA